MKKYFTSLYLVVFLSLLVQNASAQYTIPSKMDWWYEARFGMFIHFGSYSYLAHGEWAFATENWTKENYQTQVTSNFNPVDFNAGTIAHLAKNAGMKYLVITAKHHEGFCMWDTQVESFKDVSGTKAYDLPGFTKFGNRDILQELKDSCDAVGVKFCLYYSILDWDPPSQTIYKQNFSTMASMEARTAYINDMKVQLKELVDRYHPAIMWFDGDWTGNTGNPTLTSWWTKTDGIDLYNYLMALDSNMVVNERVFRSAGIGDYESPEQKVPATPEARPWETNQTMNNSWGYASWDNSYKTPETLIRQLVQVVSRDGNYLLNIGPKGDGTVPEQSVTILNAFGDWMDVYSESIYGTTRSPYSIEPNWGYYSKKAGKLFTHVFTWPANGLLKIPSLTNKVNKVYLLNDSTTLLNFTDSIGYLQITVPTTAPNSINSVVVIDVDGVPTASTQYIKTSSIKVSSEGGRRTVSDNGGTLQMAVTVLPANASDKTVSWTVSDIALASISSTGLLTGKKNGEVTVFAIANDGSDVQGKLVISISDENSYTEGVSLINSSFEFPDDNSKIKCTQNGVSINEVEGFGWKIDQCGDSGREDPTKAGLSTSSTPAFDGSYVGYIYNYDSHLYQVVEVVNQAGVTYSLTGQVHFSYSGGDIAYTGAYISLFSGTNTTQRTIAKGDSVQYIVGAERNSGWKQVVVNYTTTSDDIGKSLCIETGSSLNNGGIYWSYVDAFILTKTITTSVAGPVGNSQFKVYPNPSNNGIIHLRSVGEGSVFIYNQAVRLVYSGTISRIAQEIDLSNKEKGLYLVTIQTKNGDFFQKVMIG
ncbi:MAG: alpha-L-fucosidase [Prolixibacteraceae bacterium]